MKYNSVPEYFYKFHARLYALVLIPLLTFVVLYAKIKSGDSIRILQDITPYYVLLPVFIVMMLAAWVASFILFRSNIKSILTLGSLGERLDHYFRFTIVRFLLLVTGLMLPVIGFVLTEDYFFTILFVANLIGIACFWPTPAKVCNDLNLKGEERRLILYKPDKL